MFSSRQGKGFSFTDAACRSDLAPLKAHELPPVERSSDLWLQIRNYEKSNGSKHTDTCR